MGKDWIAERLDRAPHVVRGDVHSALVLFSSLCFDDKRNVSSLSCDFAIVAACVEDRGSTVLSLTHHTIGWALSHLLAT